MTKRIYAPPNVALATEYAERHALWAFACAHDGEIAIVGPHVDEPHALFSGTKSFWSIAALVATERGWLRLDEPLVTELHEWRGDLERERITVEFVLRMTAGYAFGGLGASVPTFERALALPLKDEPGSTFIYGGIPLQIFGAFFTRRLAQHGTTPHQFLRDDVLREAGVEIARWRQLRDRSYPFPTGAFLTAENWLRYGTYVLAQRERFALAFEAYLPNPSYGLGWWRGLRGVADTVWYASGSGGQALYIAPEREIVAVHFGDGASYKHEAFVKRLLSTPS